MSDGGPGERGGGPGKSCGPGEAEGGFTSDIADSGLAESGLARIAWAERAMPVLGLLRQEYARRRPFEGRSVAACLHITAETAVLVGLVTAAGGRVHLAASNPLSTQDDIAAALASRPEVFGYGTGQSVLDGLLRATNILLAGKTVVVAGHGSCGRAIAGRAAGLGAHVIVTEVDPVRALDAIMCGYRVLPMADAAPAGDVFITATGSRDVITGQHLEVMRDGAVLANAGHFDVEIDVRALADLAVEVNRGVRPHADEYVLDTGRRLILLAEGRVVNLIAAEGNPAAVMDLSFAAQALALMWLTSGETGLAAGVHPMPAAIDAQVARLTLAAAGARIDELTGAQQEYLASWNQGS